jgi:probable HAF family extracellular repeat protein
MPRTILVAVVICASGAMAWAAPLYTITDLGTVPGSTKSIPFGINNAGQVVGYCDIGANDRHAFLYSGGQMQDLGTLGGNTSTATGINSSGQVVGSSTTAGGYTHAFLYSGGQMQDLGTGPFGIFGPQAVGINNSGQVAGFVNVAGGWDAFLYSGGQMQDLGTFFNTYPPFPTYLGVTGINDAGQVIGYSSYLDYRKGMWFYASFLYSGGQMQSLDSTDGSWAKGINNSGQVVGWNDTGLYLYSGGKLKYLNPLIDSSSGWTFQNVQAINDLGQIVGWGTNPAGQSDAYLLTPTPEPATLSLLALGGLTLLKRRKQPPSRNENPGRAAMNDGRRVLEHLMTVIARRSARRPMADRGVGATGQQSLSVPLLSRASKCPKFRTGETRPDLRLGRGAQDRTGQ